MTAYAAVSSKTDIKALVASSETSLPSTALENATDITDKFFIKRAVTVPLPKAGIAVCKSSMISFQTWSSRRGSDMVGVLLGPKPGKSKASTAYCVLAGTSMKHILEKGETEVFIGKNEFQFFGVVLVGQTGVEADRERVCACLRLLPGILDCALGVLVSWRQNTVRM